MNAMHITSRYLATFQLAAKIRRIRLVAKWRDPTLLLLLLLLVTTWIQNHWAKLPSLYNVDRLFYKVTHKFVPLILSQGYIVVSKCLFPFWNWLKNKKHFSSYSCLPLIAGIAVIAAWGLVQRCNLSWNHSVSWFITNFRTNTKIM